MIQYLELMRNVLEMGTDKSDRTGTGTRSVFGAQMRFDLQAGLPLLTTKKLYLRAIIHELLWMLSGDTNIKYLVDNDVHIWDDWADAQGDLGPVYGSQWRSWRGAGDSYTDSDVLNATVTIDQIANVVQRIRDKPDDRRLIVSAWNPAEIDKMKLPPCHCLFQFNTRELTLEQRAAAVGLPNFVQDASWMTTEEYHSHFDDLKIPAPRRALDCQLYQRSADIFLGVPFNIASYALLTQMIAQVVGMLPGEFIWTGGDCHLYNNHLDQARQQLTRSPRALPTMHLNPKVTDLFGFTYPDFTLVGYDPHPHIAADVSV